MITKDVFLKEYNISEELFQSAGMSWEDLCIIYQDFSENKRKKYQDILDEFIKSFLKDLDKEKIKIHSFHSRIKNPEHLIAKIVRKKQKNSKKYNKLDKDNYEKFITDLIGIRCLVLFKTDWESVHNYILSQFENDVQYYVKDPILDFDSDENHYYIAEKPKAHIRNGDAREFYEKILSPDSVIDNKIYRSVHYIIKYSGIYLEIQVRTLFEEGWGEVDHTIAYPYYEDDPIFKEYTELLNRLSGLADEMAVFFKRLKELELEHLINQKQDVNICQGNLTTVERNSDKTDVSNKELEDTLLGCLQAVLDE